MLALDRGDGAGSCVGVAYQVAAEGAAATLAYLRERELVSYAYTEARLPVELEDGTEVEALAYVSNPGHAQYRGGLSLEAQAEVIARAVGPKGPNLDYLLNTVASLDALGLHDPTSRGWRSWRALRPVSAITFSVRAARNFPRPAPYGMAPQRAGATERRRE